MDKLQFVSWLNKRMIIKNPSDAEYLFFTLFIQLFHPFSESGPLVHLS
jgi:hypothetical protein